MTTLVVQDLLGGEILKTEMLQGSHYYNRIDGVRYDLTVSQFNEPIEYMDLLSNRVEAFSDTNEAQYMYLKQAVHKAWGRKSV